MLKIKLMLSEKNFETVAKELTESGHQIDETADLLLTERQTYPDLLTARKDDRIYRLPLREVTYIESLGHDILAHRGGMEYRQRCRRRHSRFRRLLLWKHRFI